MKDYVDNSEEYISIVEARLPLPEISTPILCPNCSDPYTNFDSYFNKCQECLVEIEYNTKRKVTQYLAEIPYTVIKQHFTRVQTQ